MREQGPRPFRVVRANEADGAQPVPQREIPEGDRELSSKTHGAILNEFDRIGFLGAELPSYLDLTMHHSFTAEYEAGLMDPGKVVGRATDFNDVNTESGVRAEIYAVRYNSHARAADILPGEGEQRPRAKLKMFLLTEPHEYHEDGLEVVRLNTVVTDGTEVRYELDGTVIREEEQRVRFQEEVDRWGYPIELHRGNNNDEMQKGSLTESQGIRFLNRLKDLDETKLF